MSSTNRGRKRQPNDYYTTPVLDVVAFLRTWLAADPLAGSSLRGRILDPCAGGNVSAVDWDIGTEKEPWVVRVPPTPMSYPTALQEVLPQARVVTNDIRPDSPAEHHQDFLESDSDEFADGSFDLVPTNPPFAIAESIIERALRCVPDGRHVAMFLRLNFLEGTTGRKEFWKRVGLPEWLFVHRNRPRMIPGLKRTDSIAYAHFVWRKGLFPEDAKTRFVDEGEAPQLEIAA